MGQLTGKTAVITGGGTGIGRAIAQRYHDEGAHVVITGRRKEKLMETSALIGPDSDRVYSIVADVTREDDIKRLLDAAAGKTGGIDILVNNAGVMRFGPLTEIPQENFHLMMKTNAWAPWRLMVNVLPYMEKNGGSIINISSIAGIKSYPGAGIYCMSKAAMQVLSQVFAMEHADSNIRVNCILPAVIEDTELSNPIFGEDDVPAFWEKMRTLHPLGRNGKPKDIADAALFFATSESSWITGTLLNIDGGRHMATNRPAV